MAAAAEARARQWDEWRLERVARMQEDLHRLLEFTVARTDPQASDAGAVAQVVGEACGAVRIPPADMSYEQELGLWKSWRDVHEASRPASAAGLRLLWALLRSGRVKRDEQTILLTQARRLRRWAGVYLLLMLAVIVAVHSWAAWGEKVALEAQSDVDKYSALIDQRERLRDLAVAKRGEPPPGKHAPAVSAPAPAAAQTPGAPAPLAYPEQIDARGEGIRRSLERDLAQMAWWHARPAVDDASSAWDEIGGRLVEELRDARVVIYMTRSYMLPTLYGALGALVWALRSMIGELEAGSIGFLATLRMKTRLILGMVFGFAASNLTPEGYLAVPAEGTLALCFLSGYGVEVAFSLLDRMIAGVGEWTQGAQAAQARRA